MLNKEVYYKLSDFTLIDFTDYYNDDRCVLVLDEDLIDSSIIIELILMVYNRFFEFYAYKKEIPFTEEASEPDIGDSNILAKRLNNIIDMTYERYAPMLVFQRANESDPSPKLESESNGKTRFNDTPQNEALASNEFFNDDKHSTNITASHSSTSVDSGTVAERLDELYKNWKSILRDWTNEFKGLFMEVWR